VRCDCGVRVAGVMNAAVCARSWVDDLTGQSYRVQAVFQLRIRPTTYAIGQQTIDATEPIDPTSTYKNTELEWYTSGEERGAILLTALVVRAVLNE
jgi:hypothetical protein